ncbi:HAMP domain-containing sensor histidine kinase [Eubacteriaceae bacterium ES2]|nr:HAMP domain-containing sensor histidine kinase [Eubacteriaceae bacterium ES2]
MTELFIVLCLFVSISAILYAFFCRHREKNTLQKLDMMIEAVVRGNFSADKFDESLLSSIESKFSHYLRSSIISSKNLESEKEKIKALISDVSHQTKTPLSNILIYTQLLSEHNLPPESRLCLSELENQTEKLQSLISALVKTSRLETGVLTFHPDNKPLFPLLQKAVSTFYLNASSKQIDLRLETTEETAVFDSKWTEEAICNLLDNAIKYSPIGKTVTVSVIPYDLFCRIDIIDNGIGIAEAEQAQIFQRFYRSEKAKDTEGVGIGLYLVREIANRQGGYVKVSSLPDLGSTFSLFLPRD